MEEALALFVRLSSALLARFADLSKDGIDAVTALRLYLLPDPRFGPPSKTLLALAR